MFINNRVSKGKCTIINKQREFNLPHTLVGSFDWNSFLVVVAAINVVFTS